MTRHDDEIRRRLREADPASRRELGEVERSRMRAALTSAAREGTPRRSALPFLAAVAAMATVLAVAVLLFPRGEREIPQTVAVPTVEKTPPPVPAVAAQAAVEPAVAKVRPARRTPARPRVPVAIESEPVQTTRIVFTAPGGTRILWFVGPSDAKELGS